MKKEVEYTEIPQSEIDYVQQKGAALRERVNKQNAEFPTKTPAAQPGGVFKRPDTMPKRSLVSSDKPSRPAPIFRPGPVKTPLQKAREGFHYAGVGRGDLGAIAPETPRVESERNPWIDLSEYEKKDKHLFFEHTGRTPAEMATSEQQRLQNHFAGLARPGKTSNFGPLSPRVYPDGTPKTMPQTTPPVAPGGFPRPVSKNDGVPRYAHTPEEWEKLREQDAQAEAKRPYWDPDDYGPKQMYGPARQPLGRRKKNGADVESNRWTADTKGGKTRAASNILVGGAGKNEAELSLDYLQEFRGSPGKDKYEPAFSGYLDDLTAAPPQFQKSGSAEQTKQAWKSVSAAQGHVGIQDLIKPSGRNLAAWGTPAWKMAGAGLMLGSVATSLTGGDRSDQANLVAGGAMAGGAAYYGSMMAGSVGNAMVKDASEGVAGTFMREAGGVMQAVNKGTRRNLGVMAAAGLGGMAFSSYRSKRRGFNQNRGTKIG